MVGHWQGGNSSRCGRTSLVRPTGLIGTREKCLPSSSLLGRTREPRSCKKSRFKGTELNSGAVVPATQGAHHHLPSALASAGATFSAGCSNSRQQS
eukprot:360516-Chlamydomonas_euryale.AAC.4